jgi:hypothetical protein
VQDASDPPDIPWHDHEYVLAANDTAVSFPALHKPDDGTVCVLIPCTTPHTPFTEDEQATLLKEQFAVEPVPYPIQSHVRVVPHDIDPLSDETEPASHIPGVAEHDPLTSHKFS